LFITISNLCSGLTNKLVNKQTNL